MVPRTIHTAVVVAALGATMFYDEDTNDSRFKVW